MRLCARKESVCAKGVCVRERSRCERKESVCAKGVCVRERSLCERKESVYACTREEPVCAILARSKVAMR
jgi:hypothetical protein